MLYEIFSVIISVISVLAVLGFVFMKSSKKFPSNLKEFKSEVRLQISGFHAILEDGILRSRNVVELYNQKGRTVVLTGGNRGIGLRILAKLLKCEMRVILGVRDPKSAEEAVEDFLRKRDIEGKVFYEKLDVGDMNSVKSFAEVIKQKYDKIDLLINNAGIMCAPFKITSDGFESHMAINYLGHFLLTHLLLPQIKKAGTDEQNSRVINVSSCVHSLGEIIYDDFNGKNFYYPADAYNNSKLAQVLFSVHLNKILENSGSNIQVHAVHPGVVNTDLFEHSSTTYIPWIRTLLFKTPEEGSRSIVYAGISKNLENKGGTYISNCSISKMHKLAQSPEECEKFFQYSCNLLSIKVFGKE